MTKEQRDELNRFFVHVFNEIQACEEQALRNVGDRRLSVKELHVLEAVGDLTVSGKNTMTQVADYLGIRVSSLTTAVNTLVSKGYLERVGEPRDRRVIQLLLTETGRAANEVHARYHARMVQQAASHLSEEELDVLMRSLRQLDVFFHEMRLNGDFCVKEAGQNGNTLSD